MASPNQIPKWPERLLKVFCSEKLAEYLLGDMYELYELRLNRLGKFRAQFHFLLDVLSAVRPFFFKSGWLNSIHTTMFKHYFKIAWRGLSKQKVYSGIKIGGFAIGIAACILIMLFIRHETSYDQHYTNNDRIFRLVNQWSQDGNTSRWTNLQGPLKQVIENNIPEIEQLARVVLWSWENAGANHVRRRDSKYNIYEDGFFYADPELIDILEIPLVYGSPENALSEPNSMVVSRRIAEKYFPNENPVGQQLILNDRFEDTYTVGGVMEGFPADSHLQGDFILTLFGRKFGPGTSGWCCSNYTFYTRLTPNSDKASVEDKAITMRDTYVMSEFEKAGKTELDEMKAYHSYYLQPIKNAYLNPEEVGDHITHGSRDFVWIFGAVASIILLLACVNFINLSTARSLNRAKEVGIRKTIGSARANLIFQYLSESFLYSFMAILLGLFITWLSVPFFNSLADKSLAIPWASWWMPPVLVASAALIGLLSGVYPAFYLSRFRPDQVLKGVATGGGGKASVLRSGMVVFQFTATIVLIIAALVTHEQFQLVMNKALGYNKDQVVCIQGLETMDASEKEVLKNELLKLSDVSQVTIGDYLPVYGSAIQNRSFWIADRRDLDPGFEAARWTVDEHYTETLGMEIVRGKGFSGIASDSVGAVINERMAREFGLDDPIGKSIVDMFNNEYRIIGVVKDFYFRSMFAEIQPLAMFYGQGNSTLSARLATDNFEESLAGITTVWEAVNPNQNFRYNFLDERFQNTYESLVRAKVIFLLFAALSIVVACLGLFALSAYMIEQRGKEISIRKVLGASVATLFRLLTFSYVKLVLIAIVLAVPLGWYFMDDFLGEISNRVDLSWPIFLAAGILAIGVVLLTVIFETTKAALGNPADKLRNE